MIRSRGQAAYDAREIPAELLRSSPREVELTAAGVFLLVAAWAMLAGAVGLGTWLHMRAAADADRRAQMRVEAVYTEGEVTQVVRTRGDSPRQVLKYRFAVDGVEQRGRASLPQRRSPRYEAGAKVAVGYLPSDPSQNWIRGHQGEDVPLFVAPLVSLGLLAAGGLMVWQLRRQKTLLEEGRPALARVTGTKRVQHQHSHGYRVQFEFEDMSGARREGSFERSQKPPETGAAVVILYDPEEPKRQAAYPMALVRVRKPL